MPKRLVYLMFVCTVAVGFVLPVQSAEPSFKHKTLTRWLQIYQKAAQNTPEEVASTEAIRAIGTNALPTLVRMLKTRDINVQQSAETGFSILGSVAAPAIPELAVIMHGTNQIMSLFAATSLGRIGPPALPGLMAALTNRDYNLATLGALGISELGSNAIPAVPIFLRDLRSQNLFARERAADTLGNLALEPETVVPALTNLLNDVSLPTRCLVLGAIGHFHAAAKPAIPVIFPLLQDPEVTVRISATNALHDIAPDLSN